MEFVQEFGSFISCIGSSVGELDVYEAAEFDKERNVKSSK